MMHSHHAKRGRAASKFQIMANQPDFLAHPIPAEPDALQRLSRPEALARLRTKLLTLTDDEHCVCAVASRLGLACGGFSQFSDDELRRRFPWIAGKRSGASRAELEEAINAFLLARQETTGAALACDVETREHDLCGGWNAFDNSALAILYGKVFGRAVRIG